MEVNNIKKVACIGGGVIGSSWAVLFASKGLTVKLYDLNQEQLDKCEYLINQSFDSLVGFNVITSKEKEIAISKISYTTSVEDAVKDVQFIQENGPERLEIKKNILKEIEKYACCDAIYSSSASGLLISDIAKEAVHPERCVGGHPYNPPHIIPLVEMTRGEKTDEAVLLTAKAFYELVGKEVIILNKPCPGFIANRLQLAISREVMDLVLRGICSVEDADKALVFGPGIRWAIFGHNMVMQLGATEGINSMLNKLAPAGDQWLKDMANWQEMPREYNSIAQAGVNDMMKAYPDSIGHNNEEISKYRDKMLIEILKLHGKF